jgi:hypothetical protein
VAQALRGVEEQAKTLTTRAQAALLDDHLEGALRSFLQVHELLVPIVDGWVAARSPASSPPLSSAAGLLGLWLDLPDLDCERESIGEALLGHAAEAEDDGDGPFALALDGEVLGRQAAWLLDRLRALPVPRSRYFRRLARRARGGLGDRARVELQRGGRTVLERLPEPEPESLGRSFTTLLGSFEHGDRMTLQWQNPLPGQVAILHALGDEHDAELTVLCPEQESEAAPRRHHEVIEVVGELLHVPGAAHALLILWVPELVPPRWVQQVLARQGLPPDARLWRYRYEVLPISATAPG